MEYFVIFIVGLVLGYVAGHSITKVMAEKAIDAVKSKLEGK